MTKTQILIVGQGICGTFLSWYLEKTGVSFIVLDNSFPASSSRVAAGVINPVTGRRVVKTWMIDTLLPFAKRAYTDFSSELKESFLLETTIINLFPSTQMRIAFAERVRETAEYLKLGTDDHKFSSFLEYPFGHGEIHPSYIVQINPLLESWRKLLIDRDLFRDAHVDLNDFTIKDNEIIYKDIVADKVIFCDGIASSQNPLFRNLPFAPNKGEALVIKATDLPEDYVFKKAISLVPLGNNYFWAGASHEWEFDDALPTNIFYQKTEKLLKAWLKVPFTIDSHVASIRPATLERRPFAGFHPHRPNVGILNGMGTKGCSLAPYFAFQFAEYITKNTEILREVSINRFTRILQSNK